MAGIRPVLPRWRALDDNGAPLPGAKLWTYVTETSTPKATYSDVGLTVPNDNPIEADAGGLLIVNDRCDLALAVDADGVHVGQTDLPLADARLLMGSEKILGVSTHTPAQATAALADHPDYVAYGPIFATPTKPDHEPVVGIDELRQMRQRVTVPLFAIGGIAAGHLSEILETGTDGVAVCSAVLQASNIGLAVDAFMKRFLKSDLPRR